MPGLGLRPGAAVRQARPDAGLHLKAQNDDQSIKRFPRRSGSVESKILSYKMDLIFILWFVFDDDNGPRG